MSALKIPLYVVGLALVFIASACGSTKPDITNTVVTPSAWQISGIANTPTFTITTDVLHFGGTITKVTANVEGQSQTFTLSKDSSIPGGERWTVSSQITLWTGLSAGTYYIDVTAVDSDNITVTQDKAASVVISD